MTCGLPEIQRMACGYEFKKSCNWDGFELDFKQRRCNATILLPFWLEDQQ